jgi:hypothetical protein
MRGFPPELIYLLIFAAIFLFQFLMKLAARQSAPEAPPEVRPPQPRYSTAPDSRSLEQTEAIPWSSSHLSAQEFGRRSETVPAIRPRRQRRFSRQALFATRQDVQKAVVIATVLGPCRALEPPAGEQPAERTRG